MKWFRNLTIYRLQVTPQFSDQQWQEVLENDGFHPCLPDQPYSEGWTAPNKNVSNQLSYHGNKAVLLSLRREERLLPSTVVNESLAEKVEELEAKEDRKLGRKERLQLKEDIIIQLMPQAFTRSRYTNGLLLSDLNLLIVDTPSQNRAEEFTVKLRKSLGSLKLSPLQVNDSAVATFTRWLDGSLDTPSSINIGNSCELRSIEDKNSVVRCAHQDLQNGELLPHLEAGKVAVKLELEWDEKLSFVLSEMLEVKRLRFSDILSEEVEQDGSMDPAAEFDARFTLMCLQFSQFLPALIQILGGELENQ